MSSLTLISLPQILWVWYVEHLWDYQRGSWVDSFAKFFRIIAWLVAVPSLFFIMLDIASYIIARTLGVIDDTKASTSDRGSRAAMYESAQANTNTDPKRGLDGSGTYSTPKPPSVVVQLDPSSVPLPMDDGDDLGQAQMFEGNLMLSGVDVFSPAVSRPPSPVVERRSLPEVDRSVGRRPEGLDGDGKGVENEEGDSDSTEDGLGREASCGSLSMGSSFAMIDRDSESEDTGVGMRRRTNHNENQ